MSFIRIKEDGLYWNLLCNLSKMDQCDLHEGVHNGIGCSLFWNTLFMLLNITMILFVAVSALFTVPYDVFFADGGMIFSDGTASGVLHLLSSLIGVSTYLVVFSFAFLSLLRFSVYFVGAALIYVFKGAGYTTPASNVSVWYRSFKDKYCPSVEVYQEKN